MDDHPPREAVAPELAPSSAALSAERVKLESQRAAGAGWLTAIAAFSVVNLAIILFDGNMNFVVGLGITQVSSAFARVFSQQADARGAAVAWTICITITILMTALFLWLASRAKRGSAWAFVAGMAIYGLDGLIFLAFQDWLPFGFHIYALVMIYAGLKAHWGLAKVG